MEILLDIQGQKVKVHAQVLNQQMWVHFKGKTYVVDLLAGKKTGPRGGASSTSNIVKAPMPGKVTKILVKPAESVEKGQTLVVMEAMKMEYNLKAEITGKIQSIEAKVGDQVSLGKILVKLEPGT